MSALIEVLGGDDDSNIADTLSAHKIKDPSLIMSLSDEEIGDLKINRNNRLLFVNGKLLILSSIDKTVVEFQMLLAVRKQAKNWQL